MSTLLTPGDCATPEDCYPCDEECDWNGCTKPQSYIISGSFVGSPFPSIDGTYPFGTWPPDCFINRTIWDGGGVPRVDIQARLVYNTSGPNAYVVNLDIIYWYFAGAPPQLSSDRHQFQWVQTATSCPPSGTKTMTFLGTISTGLGGLTTAPTTVQIVI